VQKLITGVDGWWQHGSNNKTSLTNMSPAGFTDQAGKTSRWIRCLSTSVAWRRPSAEVGKLINPFSSFCQQDWQLHGKTHMEAAAVVDGQQIISNNSEPENL